MASLQQHIASIDQGLAADFVDRAARPKLLSDLAALIAELVASDALAKASIEHARGLPVTPPKGGMIQLGFVLYWIEYPPAALQQIVDQLPERARRVWKLLQEILIKAHPRLKSRGPDRSVRRQSPRATTNSCKTSFGGKASLDRTVRS